MMDIKRKGLKIASQANLAQPLLSIYESIGNEIPWTPNLEVDEEIREHKLSSSECKGYVLFPLIPMFDIFAFRAGVLGHAFREQGYKPLILYDRNDLPPKPADNTSKSYTVDNVKKRYLIEWYLNEFGIEGLTIGDVLGSGYDPISINNKKMKQLQSYTHTGINIGEPAVATTRRELKRYTLDISNERVRRTYKTALQRGAMIADAIKKIISDYDLEAVLVYDTSYIYGKIPLELCHNHGINAYTHETGYHEGKLMYGRAANKIAHGRFSNREIVSQVVRTELKKCQRHRIREVMKKRESGDITRVQYSASNSSSIDVPEKHIVGIFSHLLWDAAIEPQEAIYQDFYSWLRDTIEVGARMDDTHFVIKSHPAENIRGTNESVVDWINESYESLPPNFTVLPADTDIDTYALIQDLDAGAVYASTVGLEMAFAGLPVLVGGYPPYHGFGITHDPQSKSKYRESLQEIADMRKNKKAKIRAERFAYFLFECKQIEFPHLREYQSRSEDKICIEHDEIVKDSGICSSIVNQVLAGDEVIAPQCQSLIKKETS
jgi:hypothetical protein